jgi:DNA-binding NtrC family response regulator
MRSKQMTPTHGFEIVRDSSPESTVTPISLDDRLRELETALITWALKMTGGNKSQAAALLKIKRSTLGDRINRCGLGRARGGSASDRREPAA